MIDSCTELCKRLSDDFRKRLNPEVKKQLKYEFHSADRNTLLEVIHGLQTVVQHVVQVRSFGMFNFTDYGSVHGCISR